MPIFKYEARDDQGQLVRDTIEAENVRRACQALQQQKFMVINIRQARESQPGHSSPQEVPWQVLPYLLPVMFVLMVPALWLYLWPRVSHSELLMPLHRATDLRTVGGQVVRSGDSIYSYEARNRSGARWIERVSQVDYRYTVAGRNLQGTSYCHGVGPSKGQSITVEYSAVRPELSRISGMSAAPFTATEGTYLAGVLVLSLLPLLLLLYTIGTMRRPKKDNQVRMSEPTPRT